MLPFIFDNTNRVFYNRWEPAQNGLINNGTGLTDGTSNAFMILDTATNQPIVLPLKLQEQIIEPIIALKTWIQRRTRNGGTPPTNLEEGERIKYALWPKQTDSRDYNLRFDAQGRLIGGIFGGTPTNPLDLIGIVKSSYGAYISMDYIELLSGQFLKHTFKMSELRGQTARVVAMKLADYWANEAEKALIAMKVAWVSFFGKKGAALDNFKFTPRWYNNIYNRTSYFGKDNNPDNLKAGDASQDGSLQKNWTHWDLPAANTPGARVKYKNYGDNDAEKILEDIQNTLKYRDKIGLKDGVESNYPFARGLNSATSALIELSSLANTKLVKLVEKSQNGFIAGLGVDTDRAIITSISYDGKSVPVEVVTDMPNKLKPNGDATKSADWKQFNWSVVETGKHGAIGSFCKFPKVAVLRPSYETLTITHKTLEVSSPLFGMNHIQPELNFASFTA